jgi:hypothetical protein
MNVKIEDLIGHIEYFFGNVKSDYDKDKEFEVYLKDGNWNITNKATGWVFGTTDHLMALNHLIDVKADISQFHIMLYNIVCTEGVLKRMQLKKIEEIVGVDAVDRQAAGWDSFSSSLVKKINKETTKPKLSMVDNGKR